MSNLPPLSPFVIKRGNRYFRRQIETRPLSVGGKIVILAALYGSRIFNLQRASKAASYVAKHGANRACFSADEIEQETYLAWKRKPTLSIQWLSKRVCRKLLRREGKRLSYACAANESHSPDTENGFENSPLDGREDTLLPKFAPQSESELQGTNTFWNGKASPTMRTQANIAVKTAKAKLLPSGQERIDAKIDLGAENWTIAELSADGFTQTDIRDMSQGKTTDSSGVAFPQWAIDKASVLPPMSQGTVCNRLKIVSSYFA